MPETTLYIRVKQALNWLKREKGILQKDIADKMGMAEASFTRALARIKERNDEDFVISFHSVVSEFISLDYLLNGNGTLTIETEKTINSSIEEPTINLVEMYAQRIRLVDDLRQSLKEELNEVKELRIDLQQARDDFKDAAKQLLQIIKDMNNGHGYMAAEDISQI